MNPEKGGSGSRFTVVVADRVSESGLRPLLDDPKNIRRRRAARVS